MFCNNQNNLLRDHQAVLQAVPTGAVATIGTRAIAPHSKLCNAHRRIGILEKLTDGAGYLCRAENQNIVMCAIRKKLLSPALVPAIPQLLKDFTRYVQTDLSPERINQLACLATQMKGTDIVFASFPLDLFKAAKTFDPQLGATTTTVDADFSILRDYIGRFQRGTWPDPNLVINATPSPAATDLEFSCED